MKQSASQRRMAENEVVFRRYNERVQRGFDEVRRLAEESGQRHLIHEDDAPLLFNCECSDENCQQRIKVAPSRFTEIHKNRKRFIVVCGHEIPATEKVIEKTEEYCVVEKFIQPPQHAARLNKTGVDNG